MLFTEQAVSWILPLGQSLMSLSLVVRDGTKVWNSLVQFAKFMKIVFNRYALHSKSTI